jgi:hypothetical protein
LVVIDNHIVTLKVWQPNDYVVAVSPGLPGDAAFFVDAMIFAKPSRSVPETGDTATTPHLIFLSSSLGAAYAQFKKVKNNAAK